MTDTERAQSPEEGRITFASPTLSDSERTAVGEVLSGTRLTQGPVLKSFESDFARFTGAEYAVATSSCMGALHLSYLFLGLDAGDEVIVPAQTHVATAFAVELCGGHCVFVDSEDETGNVDLDQLEASVTNKTRAVSVVHFLGVPIDMRRLRKITEPRHLFLVEDCALALGARVDDRHVGLHGDVGTFSFYPAKHIATGEGGMLITQHKKIAEDARLRRAFGVRRSSSRPRVDYDVRMVALNYRMSEVTAALGVEQLKKLSNFLEVRRHNYEALASALDDVPEARPLHSRATHIQSSHYCLNLVFSERFASKRDTVVDLLDEQGVAVSVYYPRPVPLMEYFRTKYGYRRDDFPVAASLSERGIALPVGPHLNVGDVGRIADAVKYAIAHA